MSVPAKTVPKAMPTGIDIQKLCPACATPSKNGPNQYVRLQISFFPQCNQGPGGWTPPSSCGCQPFYCVAGRAVGHAGMGAARQRGRTAGVPHGDTKEAGARRQRI